jgi:hypothetical protein
LLDEVETKRRSWLMAVFSSSASFSSLISRAISVSWLEAEEPLWRTARVVRRLGVFALRLRALASSLFALERRRMAYPKAQDYADFQRGLQQGFATSGMGFND